MDPIDFNEASLLKEWESLALTSRDHHGKSHCSSHALGVISHVLSPGLPTALAAKLSRYMDKWAGKGHAYTNVSFRFAASLWWSWNGSFGR